jgi:hypothetical protein
MLHAGQHICEEEAATVSHRWAQGKVEVRQFGAPFDELSGWSKFCWLLVGEVLAYFNLQRHNSCVVCELEEGVVRKQSAFVLQQL